MDPQATLKAIRARNQAAIERMKAAAENEASLPTGEVDPVGSLRNYYEEAPHEGVRVHHTTPEEEKALDDAMKETNQVRSRYLQRGPSSEEEEDPADSGESSEEEGLPLEDEEQEQEEPEELSLHAKARGDLARSKMGQPKRYG